MEGLRKTLDNLMGKDRNLPIKEQILKKKHFDDPDVCKFFLIGFCPHELFTYVKSSNIGECHYRHDQQFKISFESDPNKENYQIKYEEDLISFLESITSELDIKIKRCLERIEMPPPEQVLNKDAQIELENLDKEITEKISEAEHLGEMGLIEQSEKLMKEIEQIKIQRNLLTNTKEHVAIYKDRQMKVCEICGALQSAIDNEKRIQTHKEGKIHSAYLKIRQYLDLLRKKKMERRIKESEIKQKDKLMKELKVKEKEKNFDRDYKDYKRKYDDYNYDRDKRKKYSRSRSRDKSYKRMKDFIIIQEEVIIRIIKNIEIIKIIEITEDIEIWKMIFVNIKKEEEIEMKEIIIEIIKKEIIKIEIIKIVIIRKESIEKEIIKIKIEIEIKKTIIIKI